MKTTTNSQHSTCRAVSCLLTKHKGTPVSTALSGAPIHALGAEEALYGLGILGTRENGQAFARVGIYGFSDGAMKLRFPVDYDLISGAPKLRPSKSGRDVSPAEISLVNWIQGGLFDVSRKDGSYFLRMDSVNGQPQTSPLADAVLDAARKEFPDRKHFAAPRKIEESVDMFEKWLERRDGDAQEIQKPAITPLLSLEQYDRNSPVVEVMSINEVLFRSMAIARFSSGLINKDESFVELRKAFISALKQADRMLEHRAGEHVMRAAAAPQYEVLMAKAKGNLAPLGNIEERVNELQRRAMACTMGLRALRAYYLNRTEPGRVSSVNMLRVKSGMDAEGLPKALFTMAQGVPMQITSEFRSNGDFPYEGEMLSFNRENQMVLA